MRTSGRWVGNWKRRSNADAGFVSFASGLCGPAHEMTAMACLLLALLVAAVLLASAMGSTGALSPRMLFARIAAAAGGLAPPRPPSLLVLSISRT